MSKKTTSKAELHRCADCKRATLARNKNNPVIAICALNGERYVANAVTNCKSWVKDWNEKKVGELFLS